MTNVRIPPKMREPLRRKICFVLLFCVTFSLCLAITAAYVQNKSQLAYTKMEQLAMTNANRVGSVITKLLYKTQVLSALVIQNNGEVQDFERVAATILDDPSIRNVILAPDGVVSHVYPLEGNEAVLGLDYFSQGAGNQEAKQAKETGQLVLGGPFDLVQGGQALVGRLPVYLGQGPDRRFWGLVSVTLNYPQALEGAELDQLKTNGLAYEIWRFSPDTGQKQIIACSAYAYSKHTKYVEYPTKILNADWYFRLSPLLSWYQYPETWLFSLAGLLISFLAAFLVTNNRDLRSVKSQLEELTYLDTLTGVLNRRGAFRALEDLLSGAPRPFLLCYLDINWFKYINDTHGHGAGDHVLQYFSGVLARHVDRGHILARVGGDEFLLVLTNTADKGAAAALFEQVHGELQQKAVPGRCQNDSLTFSYGVAAYPADGAQIDDLIAVADSNMYQAKNKAHGGAEGREPID